MEDIRDFSLFQFLILSLASCKSVWHRQVNRNIRSIVFRRCRSPNHRPSRLNNNNNSQRAYDLIEGEKRSIKDHCWREREDKAGSLEVALMDSFFFSLTSVYSIHYRYGRPDWSMVTTPRARGFFTPDGIPSQFRARAKKNYKTNVCVVYVLTFWCLQSYLSSCPSRLSLCVYLLPTHTHTGWAARANITSHKRWKTGPDIGTADDGREERQRANGHRRTIAIRLVIIVFSSSPFFPS